MSIILGRPGVEEKVVEKNIPRTWLSMLLVMAFFNTVFPLAASPWLPRTGAEARLAGELLLGGAVASALYMSLYILYRYILVHTRCSRILQRLRGLSGLRAGLFYLASALSLFLAAYMLLYATGWVRVLPAPVASSSFYTILFSIVNIVVYVSMIPPLLDREEYSRAAAALCGVAVSVLLASMPAISTLLPWLTAMYLTLSLYIALILHTAMLAEPFLDETESYILGVSYTLIVFIIIVHIISIPINYATASTIIEKAAAMKGPATSLAEIDKTGLLLMAAAIFDILIALSYLTLAAGLLWNRARVLGSA